MGSEIQATLVTINLISRICQTAAVQMAAVGQRGPVSAHVLNMISVIALARFCIYSPLIQSASCKPSQFEQQTGEPLVPQAVRLD